MTMTSLIEYRFNPEAAREAAAMALGGLSDHVEARIEAAMVVTAAQLVIK